MPKPIPWPYQQNSKRLWMPWILYGHDATECWPVKNTRANRKKVRGVLQIIEAAQQSVGYQYTGYGVSLSGRVAPTKPAWQDWPRRRGPGHDLCWDPAAPLVGGIREAVQQRDFAAGEMMGILEKDREEVEKHAQSTAGGTAALLSRLRGG